MGRLIPILISYFLIDLAIINSSILWQVNKKGRSSDQLAFLTALVRHLKDGYSSRKRKERASLQAKKCVVSCVASERNSYEKGFFPTIDDLGNVAER
ncbi:hypothetical protein TNCV_2716041 [Trichonephila clavipes]|nr:hypothetical protein TNCV_2716041 [Trichonephila clavipes]